LWYYNNKNIGFTLDKLKAAIEELIYNRASDFEIAKLIRSEIKNYYETLPEIFKNTSGKDFVRRHTKKIDSIIKLVYLVATREMFKDFFPSKNAVPFTIAALGSYGREQLSPKSDIDIMFVYKDIAAYNTKAIIEKMLYLLWDCGLKLGHRVHEINELENVANSDITIKTAILEARFIEGSKYVWFETQNKINHIRHTNQKEFILEKIKERRALRAKYPLMMEPNIKEGVGGFRDANIVFWIGKLLYNVPNIKELPNSIVNEKDYAEFATALEFLFKVRSALHLVTNKKTDRLRLEYIPDITKLLGYKDSINAHLLFAKKVNLALRKIWLYTRIWLNLLASSKIEIYKNYLKSNKNFTTINDALKFLIDNANKKFSSHPTLNHNLLNINDYTINKTTNKLILKAFDAKYTSSILVALSEVNKLGTLIPPLKKVIALPQFDGYHKYSVDTHSIKAIEALENITDKRVLKVFNNLSQKDIRILKLVTLLHDAGKGRISDHHIVGQKLFKAYAKRLNLSEQESNLGQKLILYHTLLSKTAQKEDIYNPKTIAQFAAIFPTKLELDLIYILTYADTTAVGNNIYNEFSARLFYNLYQNALEFLEHKEFLDETAKRVKRIQSIKRSKAFKELPKTLQRKILNIESNLPFIKYTTNRIIEISKRALDVNDYIFEITNNKFLTIEIIRKKPLDLGYLLSKLSNLNLVNMDIIKLFDNKKYFKIDFNQKVTQDDIFEIEQIVHDSFCKQNPIKLPKPKISKVQFDCEHSQIYAKMRLIAKDQKGLLAYLMNIFEKLDIQIVSSKIYTHKQKVDDLFLIEKNGNFCKNLDIIKKELLG
jgi:[protein-PII] uridylyltransferase